MGGIIVMQSPSVLPNIVVSHNICPQSHQNTYKNDLSLHPLPFSSSSHSLSVLLDLVFFKILSILLDPEHKVKEDQ